MFYFVQVSRTSLSAASVMSLGFFENRTPDVHASISISTWETVQYCSSIGNTVEKDWCYASILYIFLIKYLKGQTILPFYKFHLN